MLNVVAKCYKLLQMCPMLLQSVTKVSNVVTKYYKVLHKCQMLLQSVTECYKNVKCCYKLLQSVTLFGASPMVSIISDTFLD